MVSAVKLVVRISAIIIAVCVTYVAAHLALIEVGREVVVVFEPTPAGRVRKARLWIVDENGHAWIHPGNANARWWIGHMDTNSMVEIYRSGEKHRYRAQADLAAHADVHQLLRCKYGFADWWVRFLVGTYTRSGMLTWGEKCTAVPIRLDPI